MLGTWLRVMGVFSEPLVQRLLRLVHTCGELAALKAAINADGMSCGRHHVHGCEVALPLSGVLTLCILASDAFWQARWHA